jgi:hypothetical protein
MLAALVDESVRAEFSGERARSKIIESTMGYRDNVVRELDADGAVKKKIKQLEELRTGRDPILFDMNVYFGCDASIPERLRPPKILERMTNDGLSRIEVEGADAGEREEFDTAGIECMATLSLRDWPNCDVTEAVNNKYIQGSVGGDAFSLSDVVFDPARRVKDGEPEPYGVTYADIKEMLADHKLVNFKLGDSPVISVASPPRKPGSTELMGRTVDIERTVSIPNAFMDIEDEWVPGELEAADGGTTFKFKRGGRDESISVNDGNADGLYRLIAVVCENTNDKLISSRDKRYKRSWILSSRGVWIRNSAEMDNGRFEDRNAELSGFGEVEEAIRLRGGALLYRNFGADRKLEKMRKMEEETKTSVKQMVRDMQIASVGRETV